MPPISDDYACRPHFIEWAERLGDYLPADHLAVRLEHAGDAANSDRRILTFTAGGPRSSALMAKLQLPR